MTAIVRNNDHKLLAVGGMPDHVHIFFSMRPSQSLSDLMQDIKGSSSRWINEQKFLKTRFSWQEGYGAFSYRKSDVSSIIEYVRTQERHHRKQNFLEEYEGMLKEEEVAYDPKYIFTLPR